MQIKEPSKVTIWNYVPRVWCALIHGRSVKEKPSDPFANLTLKPTDLQDYLALRERFTSEGTFRRERQTSVMSWVSGILLAIMVALIQMIAEGHSLPIWIKVWVALMIAVFGAGSALRILHDQVVAQFRNDMCVHLDVKMGLRISDRNYKLPPQQHQLFVAMISLLSAGAIFMVFSINRPAVTSHTTQQQDVPKALTQQVEVNTTAQPPVTTTTKVSEPPQMVVATPIPTKLPDPPPSPMPAAAPTSGPPKP